MVSFTGLISGRKPWTDLEKGFKNGECIES